MTLTRGIYEHMATINIKDYESFDIGEALVRTNSVLLDYDVTESMALDQSIEGLTQLKIIGTLTARQVQTAEDGHRIVIDGITNNITIYNADDEKTVLIDGALTNLPSPGLGDAGNSQIRIGGTLFVSASTDAEYDYGTLLWNGGFGANGVATFIEPVGNGQRAIFAVLSDGTVYHYAQESSPVFEIRDDGGLGIQGPIWAQAQGVAVADLDIGADVNPFGVLYIKEIQMDSAGNGIDMNGEDINMAGGDIDLNNGDLRNVGDIFAAGGADIGTSADPFDHLYIEDIYFEAQSSGASVDGQLRYYASGGSEGFRTEFGGFDFQLDATAV